MEFGVTALLNKIISPIMKPLFNLPGASALRAITCFFSDNPSIVLVAKDPSYAKYFKKYQWATMISFGTTFGMGIIIIGGILGIQSGKYASSVAVGTVCAIMSSSPSIADAMKMRDITTFSMFAHLIGGIVAGLIANYAYQLMF